MILNKTPDLLNMYDCFKLSGRWANGTILPKHERESEAGYARRCQSFVTPGIYNYLMNTFDVLFAREPSRTGHDDLYAQFLGNAGQGLDLTSLIKRAMKMGEVQGSCWLVMDSSIEQPDNMEAMVAQRTFPFFDIVYAHNVNDIVVDMVGNIVKFEYWYTDTESSLNQRWLKTYTPGKCVVSDDKGQPRRQIVLTGNRLPIIPVVPSGEPLLTSQLPTSPTLGLYQMNRNIAVTYSLMDESLYAQQFSVLVITGMGGQMDATVGTNNALSLPLGATAQFIAPSGTPIDSMIKRVDQNITLMQKTFANLISSGESQSGIAKVLDRQVGSMQLKDLSTLCERIERATYELFCDYVGKTPDPSYTVIYYKDFDLGDLAAYISQASTMLGMDFTVTTKTEVKKWLLRKVFADSDPVDLAEILDAEDEAEDLITPDLVPDT